ncbi:MAG: hypothetical protein O3B37_06220 [Proteobacteria bacterium]|nr:hypothetical protein [Pseudomonadota bacterium]
MSQQTDIAAHPGRAANTIAPTGWLRGPGFDSGFILGTAALGLTGGAILLAAPQIWPLAFLPYIWLLGYPHLFATYSQIAFDRASFSRHRRLNIELPLLILACVAGLAVFVGTWAIVSIYLYWQWFHFTRQSYGVARSYARRHGRALPDTQLTDWVIYAVPVCGILWRSWQAPGMYLGAELRVIAVPVELVAVALVFTTLLVGAWSVGRCRQWRRGELPVAHTLYLVSHIVMFTAGYILIAKINFGWFALSVWHSAQYVLFVWLINRDRFRDGPRDEHRLLSYLSQPGRWLWYMAVLIGGAAILFFTLRTAVGLFAIGAVPLTLVLFQTINFHHYTVDAVIWRRKRKPATPQRAP